MKAETHFHKSRKNHSLPFRLPERLFPLPEGIAGSQKCLLPHGAESFSGSSCSLQIPLQPNATDLLQQVW